jgi:hypothetical protein
MGETGIPLARNYGSEEGDESGRKGGKGENSGCSEPKLRSMSRHK